METLQSYRHSVDKKVKEIFIDAIKKAIKKIDKNKFGFIGSVGSLNKELSHDIDLLLFPNKNQRLGEVIIEILRLYDEVDKIMKKEHERYYLVPCPRKDMQEMVYYLSSIEEGGAGLIPVHSLFFPDYVSFKRFNPAAFQKVIKKVITVFHGRFDIIKKLPCLPQKILEPYFIILNFEMSARIKTFPRHLIRASFESLFGYIKERYGIKINDKVPKDYKQMEKEFVKLLKQIDKVTYDK